MSDHVKVLEDLFGYYPLMPVKYHDAIRSVLEENERLRAIEGSEEFSGVLHRATYAEARIEAVLDLHREIQGYCRACGGYWPCSTTKMLREEK